MKGRSFSEYIFVKLYRKGLVKPINDKRLCQSLCRLL